jgi:AraC-like DNA-binding protein
MDWLLPKDIFCVSLMATVAAEHGMPADACLRGSGIETGHLSAPGAEVLPRQELAVIANIVRELGDVPGLALEIGRRIHMGAVGPLVFALSSCETMGAAIAMGVRYRALVFPLTNIFFEKNGDGLFSLVLDDEAIAPPLRAFVAERDAVAMVNQLWEIFGDIPLRRMCFRAPEPGHADALAGFFGLRPQFSCGRNFGAVDQAWLDQPMLQADAHAEAYWRTQLDALLARRWSQAGLAGKVRAILRRDLQRAADMERVAEELCMTSRNLRRLLADEGVSFREILDDVRQTLAEDLLLSARFTVDQVADRLGYDRTASFREAFKRWKKVPPSQWRGAGGPRWTKPASTATGRIARS